MKVQILSLTSGVIMEGAVEWFTLELISFAEHDIYSLSCWRQKVDVRRTVYLEQGNAFVGEVHPCHHERTNLCLIDGIKLRKGSPLSLSP